MLHSNCAASPLCQIYVRRRTSMPNKALRCATFGPRDRSALERKGNSQQLAKRAWHAGSTHTSVSSRCAVRQLTGLEGV
jgi:hypothetical protein